jgi:Phosphotransferase enzyme family
VTEFIEGGNPPVPVTPHTVAEMLATADRLAAVEPCAVAGLTHDTDAVSRYWIGARELAADDARGSITSSLLSSTLTIDAQDWLVTNLARVVELERGFGAAFAGESLLHNDLRTDNVVASPSRGFVPVDWAWASIGSPLFDVVTMLPSLHLDGAGPPWETINGSTIGAAASPGELSALVAGVLGEFVRCALRPPPPGIAHVRLFQARQAAVCLDWLRHLID